MPHTVPSHSLLLLFLLKSHTAQAEDLPSSYLNITCCPSLSGLPSLCFQGATAGTTSFSVSYTHLRAHETSLHLVCRLLLEKKKEAGGRFFLLFIISYCMLSLHIITLPLGYVGVHRSNINNTRHQILIRHKFVTHKGLIVKIYIILVCTQQQAALHIFDVIRTP